MKKLFTLFLSVSIAFLLCGCGTEEYSKDESYVQNIKNLVNTSVEYTRTWREKDNSFDISNTESSKEYIAILDKLCQTYRKILLLQYTDKFDEYGNSMRENISGILSVTSEIKSHASYALDKADDSLFKNEKQELFEAYDEYLDEITITSQYIQTFWRNA